MARCIPVTSETCAWHAVDALVWPPDAVVYDVDSSEAVGPEVMITVDGGPVLLCSGLKPRLETPASHMGAGSSPSCSSSDPALCYGLGDQ